MKLTDFGEFKTGRVEPISTGRGDDWAFVPNPLPPDWSIPSSMWPLIVQARERIAALNGIGQTLPDPFLLLRPLQRREAISSTSLEGTFVTPEEALLFEIDKDRRSGSTARTMEWREVFNYYKSLQKGRARLKGRPLDNDLVLVLHKGLMRHTRGEKKTPGQFRDCQVYVGRHRYNPPPAGFLPDLLENLENAYKGPPEGIDPLVYAFVVHYQFEVVHPFSDGNGRVGRLLLTLMVFAWLDLSDPWFYLSEFFDRNRGEYLRRLYKVSTSGEWTEWIEFCLKGTIEEADAAIERCAELRNLKERYLELVGDAGPRLREIVELLFSTPVLDAPRVKKRCGVSYPTAKSDIKKLVDAGILSPIEDTHPNAWGASEIMRIAFE